MPKPTLPPARLRLLRRAYEGREVPLTMIARGGGVSVTALERLAQTHDWQRATPAERAAAATAAPALPSEPIVMSSAAAHLPHMVDRVVAIIEREIAAIEAGGAGSAPVPTLTKLLTDLKRVAADAAKEGEHDGHASSFVAPRNVAALRADLVARLERLRSAPAGGGDPAGLDAA